MVKKRSKRNSRLKKKYSVLLIEPNNNKYGEGDFKKPLGGSETIFIFLVRALKKRKDIALDVFFRDSGDFKTFVKDKNYDLVISYRSPEPLFHVQGKINAIYLQDLPNPQSIALMNVLVTQGRLNKLIFLSHFQKKAYLQHMPAVSEGRNCLMFENGIDLNLFDSNINKENAFIYASAPNRGLDVLLDLWPEIHKQLPEYTLKVTGSTKLYNVDSNPTELNKNREELLKIGKELYNKDIVGVEWLSGLSHAELITELEKSKALLYPSTFPETCCHVLNCALHAGAVPIISQVGAIIEKVVNGESGIIVPGDPNSKEFKKMYVKAVVEAVKSGEIEDMIKTNRGSYTAWDIDRLTDRLISFLLKIEEVDGINQKVLGVICAKNDRKENRRINFRNLVWYSPIDVMTEEITGMPLDQARNVAASMAIGIKADWLLFMDDDIYGDKYFVMDMVERALEHDADVVVANYAYKSERLTPTSRVVRRSDNRAIDCYGLSEEEVNDVSKYYLATSGVGAVLISTKALKKIGKPYFRTQNIQFKQTGEDSYFFQQCNALGLKIWLAMDVPIVHLDEKTGKLYGLVEHIRKIKPQIGNIPSELKHTQPQQVQPTLNTPADYKSPKEYYKKMEHPNTATVANMDSRIYNILREAREHMIGGTVLDAGSGDGYITEHLGAGFKVIRMDIKEGEGIIEHDMDTAPYPFDGDSFDGVVCSEILEHLFNPQVAISELNRVLKTNGIMILTVPNFDNIDSFFMWKRDILYNPSNVMSMEHIRHYNIAAIKDLLKGKFEIINVIGNSPHMNPFFNIARQTLGKYLKDEKGENYPNKQIQIDRVIGECFPEFCRGLLFVTRKL